MKNLMQLTIMILMVLTLSTASLAGEDKFKTFNELVSDGELVEALDELNRMIGEDPQDFEVYQMKYELFYDLDQLDSIDVLLSQMEQLSSCDHEIVALDRAYLDYGDSARFFSQILEVNLAEREGFFVDHARWTIGMLLYSRDNYYGCASYLGQIQHPEIIDDEYYFYFASAYYMLDLFPKAIRNFQKAASLKGDYLVRALFYEGLIYQEQGRMGLFEKKMKQAKKLDPDYYQELMAFMEE